jgi:hypothetical protein
MSNLLSGYEYDDNEYDLGDRVSFLHDGERLTGTVVRVYASRLNYHIQVDGRRYEASVPGDDIRKA